MRMLRIPLMALAGLSLAACAIAPPASIPAIPAAPVVVADKIILDEQIGIGVEASYKAIRLAVELAVDLGRLKGEPAAQAQALNRKAFALTQATQAAYRSANGASYRASAKEALATITALIALMRGN